ASGRSPWVSAGGGSQFHPRLRRGGSRCPTRPALAPAFPSVPAAPPPPRRRAGGPPRSRRFMLAGGPRAPVTREKRAPNESMADTGIPRIALVNPQHQVDAALRLARVGVDITKSHNHRVVAWIGFQQWLEYRHRVVDAMGKQIDERK